MREAEGGGKDGEAQRGNSPQGSRFASGDDRINFEALDASCLMEYGRPFISNSSGRCWRRGLLP